MMSKYEYKKPSYKSVIRQSPKNRSIYTANFSKMPLDAILNPEKYPQLNEEEITVDALGEVRVGSEGAVDLNFDISTWGVKSEKGETQND